MLDFSSNFWYNEGFGSEVRVKKNIFVLSLLLVLGISLIAAAQPNTPKVVIRTIFGDGDIGIELFPEQAPITVDNFLQHRFSRRVKAS